MPRNRLPENAWLPDHVFYNKTRHEYIVRYTTTDDSGEKLKVEERLCDGSASKQQVCAEARKYFKGDETEDVPTLREALTLWMKTPTFQKYSELHKDNCQIYLDDICNHPISCYGMLGNCPADRITTKHIAILMEKYPSKNAGEARRKLISKTYRYHIRVTAGINFNPACDARDPEHEKKRRTYYLSDEDYQDALPCFTDKWQAACEISYLCAARRNEVFNLTINDVTQAGLRLTRGKGSNSEISLWTDRLRNAVKLALSARPNPDNPSLFQQRDGRSYQPLKKSGKRQLDNAWKRQKERAQRRGVTVDWQYKDLKAKGVSDRVGDIDEFVPDEELLKLSGHKTTSAAKHYWRKEREIHATR